MIAVFSLGIISKEQSSAVQASPWLCLLFCLRAPIRHPACVRAEQTPFPAGNLNKRLPTPQTDHAIIRLVLYGGLVFFPISAAKGLHSIHRQVKNSADSLVSLSHGSQSPNFLLLFLCHCPAPPLFFKQSSKSCPTPSRRDSRREQHASHLRQWRCVQRLCPVQQRTVWHTAFRCLRGY